MNTSWLIFLDGTEPSLKTIDFVVTIATIRSPRTQLFLVNVQVPLSLDSTQFIDPKVVADCYRDAGEIAWAQSGCKLDAAGPAYSSHIMIGETAPVVVEFAWDKACKLIIMGSCGFGGVIGVLIGYITTKVAYLSAAPVLVFR